MQALINGNRSCIEKNKQRQLKVMLSQNETTTFTLCIGLIIQFSQINRVIKRLKPIDDISNVALLVCSSSWLLLHYYPYLTLIFALLTSNNKLNVSAALLCLEDLQYIVKYAALDRFKG